MNRPAFSAFTQYARGKKNAIDPVNTPCVYLFVCFYHYLTLLYNRLQKGGKKTVLENDKHGGDEMKLEFIATVELILGLLELGEVEKVAEIIKKILTENK